MIKHFVRSLSGFARASGARRRLALEALAALCYARLVTLRAPRRYARHLGTRSLPDHDTAADPAVAREAVEIGRMVERVARALPFPTRCLQHAIAARRMLRRRGVAAVLHLGVNRDGAARSGTGSGDPAHAWVRIGDQFVTGGDDVSRYVVVGSFV